MSSDGGGSDGQGNQNEAENDLAAQQMNAEITGDYSKYNRMAAEQAASTPSAPSNQSNSQASMSSLTNTVDGLKNYNAGPYASQAQQYSPQAQQIQAQQSAQQFAADGMSWLEYLDAREDEQYGGYTETPNTFTNYLEGPKSNQDAMPGVGPDPYGTNGFYNLEDVEKAQQDSEQGFLGSLFGVEYAPEFEEGKGWDSVNNTSLNSVASSPAGSLVSTVLGAPAVLGASLAGYNLLSPETNKYGSIVMDQTKDYDPSILDSIFGANPEYNTDVQQPMLADNNDEDYVLPTNRNIFNRQPNTTAPVDATEEDVPGPLDFYQQPYEKQFSYWDGNKFVLAPFKRKA